MNREIILFNKILSKYKFRNEIPSEIRGHTIAGKKTSLAETLKRAGDYSLFYSIVLSLFFFLKNSGINVSVIICKVLVSAMIITFALPATYTVARIVSTAFTEKTAEERQLTETITQEEKINTKTEIRKLTAETVKIVITFSGIECSKSSGKICDLINEKISDQISRALSEDKSAVLNKDSENLKGDDILTGRLHRLGDKYILTLKIIDVSTGSIKSSRTYSFKEIENFEADFTEILPDIARPRNKKN